MRQGISVIAVSNAEGGPQVVVRQRARGERYPWVYMNESTWPEVRRQFAAQKVAEPIWWVAGYPGSVGPHLYPGAYAHQFSNDGPYDRSVVADYVPGLASAPPPRPVHLEGETMLLRNADAVILDDGTLLTGEELTAIEFAYRNQAPGMPVIVDSPTLYYKLLRP